MAQPAAPPQCAWNRGTSNERNATQGIDRGDMSDLIVVITFGIMQGAIYAAVALGLVLIFGVTDVVNFAYGELVTLGAFGVILLTPPLGFPIALVATLLAVAAFSGLLYHGAFKFTIGNHLQGLVLSLGLVLIVENVLLRRYSDNPRRGPAVDGFLNLPGDGRIAMSRVIVVVALLLTVAAFYLILTRTWIGIALRACGSDHAAAATLGLSARKVGFYAFVVSGLLAAAAGVAIASIYPVNPLTGVGFLLKGFVIVIIGGAGSVTGAVGVALALGLLESLGASYIDPAITDVYGFVLMIVVLLIAPEGITNRQARRAG